MKYLKNISFGLNIASIALSIFTIVYILLHWNDEELGDE